MYINAPTSFAVAILKGGTIAPRTVGTVHFYQKPEGVLVVARASGLPQTNKTGFFALHIHEGSSCMGENFAETGGHYNPARQVHPRHAGDLPPLLSDNGEAYMTVMTNRFSVNEIIGKTVIVHSGPDDFVSQPAGASGDKIACGVIRRI